MATEPRFSGPDLELVPKFKWKRLIAKLPLPSTTRAIAQQYGEHAKKDGTSCYPGIALIARETGRSERTVLRHITLLRDDLGLIWREASGSTAARREHNDKFWLTKPKDDALLQECAAEVLALYSREQKRCGALVGDGTCGRAHHAAGFCRRHYDMFVKKPREQDSTTRHENRDLPTVVRDDTTLMRDQPTPMRAKRGTTSRNSPYQSSEQSRDHHPAPSGAASLASERGAADPLRYGDPWFSDEERIELIEGTYGLFGPGQQPAVESMIQREVPFQAILNWLEHGNAA